MSSIYKESLALQEQLLEIANKTEQKMLNLIEEHKIEPETFKNLEYTVTETRQFTEKRIKITFLREDGAVLPSELSDIGESFYQYRDFNFPENYATMEEVIYFVEKAAEYLKFLEDKVTERNLNIKRLLEGRNE